VTRRPDPDSGRAARGPSAGGAFRSLAVRNYRLFAAGQLVSLIGTWMQLTTQDWLVLALGGSGTALGITFGLQYAPTLLVGLYAGVVADRVDKRRLLVATQSAAGALAAGMCLLIGLGAVTLPVVYGFAAALGVVTAFDTPTRQAFVGEMVGAERLPNAVALNSITFNTARVVGPALAGALIGVVGTMPGATWVFALNAVSFSAVVTGLVRMRTAELFPAPGVARGRGQLRAGLGYVVRHRTIVVPVLMVGVVGTLGLNFPVTLALMARDTFHGTAATYGTLTAAVAAGSVLGALGSARRRGRPRPATLLASATAFGLFETVMAVMPTWWLLAIAAVPTGAAVLMFTTTANATVQLAATDAMRGRVMAVYLLVFLGTTPIGAPLVGGVCEWFGPRAGLALGGVSCLVATAGAALLNLRRATGDGSSRGPRLSRVQRAIGGGGWIASPSERSAVELSGATAPPSPRAVGTGSRPPAGASR
jgi:MFS family permease